MSEPTINKHWPLYVTTTVLVDGKYENQVVRNIEDGVFCIDQQYAFNINDPEDTGSVTVIRMCIPKGTEVEKGYTEIRNSLEVLGIDVVKVCRAMGFYEVIGERDE